MNLTESQTLTNLMRAFAGESQARNRYTFAAGVCREQKLHLLEAVFHFTAGQEKEHAEIFYQHMKDLAGKTMVDVGTGAGFPGVPLRIVCPAVRMTLLDSLNKRIDFLKEVCDQLGYADVDCVHGRAEEFAAKHRESFDFATSRAVANFQLLTELCLPLVKVGGTFIAMKSVDSDEELKSAEKAISILGGRVERTVDYQIPGTDVTHRLVFIKKIKETPKKYPRAFAKIKKNPV